MAERPQWVPDGVDLGRLGAARTHDHHLSGSRNVAVDRELTPGVIGGWPDSGRSGSR